MKTNQLKSYLLFWGTQSLSALGSAMTSYALILWLYLRTGSALKTALLTVSSYAPYVLVSIFAGALSERWNTLQFFTIPVGFLAGGFFVDRIFESLMAGIKSDGVIAMLFGRGKGPSAAMLFFIIGVCGVLVCVIFNLRLKKITWRDCPENPAENHLEKNPGIW